MTEPGVPAENLSELIHEVAGEVQTTDPHLEGAALPLTDVGNARRFALYLADELRWVPELEIWRAWDGRRWVEADVGRLTEYLHTLPQHIQREVAYAAEGNAHERWARDSSFESRLGACLKNARGVPTLWTSVHEFDQRHMLNLPNCTVDLSEGLSWHEHDRADMLTGIAATGWEPDAQSDLLEDTLQRFLPDPAERDYVLRCLSVAALSPRNLDRTLLLLFGPTSTGKSTLMDLTLRTLGSDIVKTGNVSVMRGNLDERGRPDLVRVLDGWLIVLHEASQQWELHADQVKRFTGGDPVVVRPLHSNRYVERVIGGTPLIVANDVPHIKGADDAVRRRLRCLLMDAPASLDDQGRLRDALIGDEGSRRAWLALLLRHYVDARGRYPDEIPRRFAEKTLEIFNLLDDVAQVMQHLVDDNTLVRAVPGTAARHCITVTQTWACYHEWLRKLGSQQMRGDQVRSPVEFGRKLRGLGYDVVRAEGSRLLGWQLGNTPIALVATLA